MGEHPENLLDHVSNIQSMQLDAAQESAWVEVIRKMDEVYSDLIQYEVDLEEKNAALEDAQRFISSVVESVSDVLIVCDENGVVLQANSAMANLVGLESDALAGKSLSTLIAEGNGDHLSAVMGGWADKEIRDCEVKFHSDDGQTDIIAINCSARLDHNGKSAGVVLTGRPVGELRRAYEALNLAHRELKQVQQQLIQQEKMASLGRLVAGVAHELNNPISFIYGNIHMLDRYYRRLVDYLSAIHDGVDETERERLRKDLKVDSVLGDLSSLVEGTQEGAERISEIVMNLRRLSFSSTDEPQPINLEKVVNTAVKWVSKSGRRKEEFSVDMPSDLIVCGHEGQIHQVFVNLIENALDATAGNPAAKIAVRGTKDEHNITVSVYDNGPGLDDDLMTKVFEPFFTTKKVGEGTGLGLWISYGIAKDCGGVLKAANAPEGGAVFTLQLPCADGSCMRT
ncbi:MAG: ATP-binding protein [Magnetovibrio sp.]|nr:ATP-binding protein [Magnetovibrio sp.]